MPRSAKAVPGRGEDRLPGVLVSRAAVRSVPLSPVLPTRCPRGSATRLCRRRGGAGWRRRGRGRPRRSRPRRRGPARGCRSPRRARRPPAAPRPRSVIGSTLLIACSQPAICVAGHEQSTEEELRDDHDRHELHRLELGAGERAAEQAERDAEHRVGDRDHDDQPGAAGRVQVEQPVRHAGGDRRLDGGGDAEGDAVRRRAGRACPSGWSAVVPACRWCARGASRCW